MTKLYAYKTPDGELVQETVHKDIRDSGVVLWRYCILRFNLYELGIKQQQEEISKLGYQRVEVKAVEVMEVDERVTYWQRMYALLLLLYAFVGLLTFILYWFIHD